MNSIRLTPHHCGISVGDLDGAAEWFDRVLGFALEREDDMLRSQGIRVAILRNSEFSIELFQHEDSRPGPTEGLSPDEDLRVRGTKHICFSLEDLESFLAHCRENQVSVAMGPIAIPGQGSVAFIHGPSGILIEFFEPRLPATQGPEA